MTIEPLAAPEPPPVVAYEPSKAERWALRILQLGAIVVVLISSMYKTFELDRFFIPKELTLHLTAFVAGLLTVKAFRRVQFTRIDLLLVGYLLLSSLSVLTATNIWVGARALAISVSAIAIFWSARALRAAGLARPLLQAAALAVILGALTACLQTYGVRTDLFSMNRAPGGTLGNRNFVAHMAAFGMPVVLWATLTAARTRGFLLGALGSTAVAASLVLTRSRAGWLAIGSVLVVWLTAVFLAPALRLHRRTSMRFAGLLTLAVVGVAAAVYTPNTLRWRSENPYLESMRSVANFQEGSGHGRLVQYRRSLRMLASEPILGVGPGNWSVRYPRFAVRGDPSLDNNEPGTTSNPWPSSDWVAFAAERGAIATALLAIVFIVAALRGLTMLMGAREPNDALAGAALLSTVIAVGVAGMFDAVLLLGLPTLLVWLTLGALWPAPVLPPGERTRSHTSALLAVSLIAGLGALRSMAQIAAIALYTQSSSATMWSWASFIDPGNYRIQVRLAHGAGRMSARARCRHARAAHDLLPSAQEARALASRCGSR